MKMNRFLLSLLTIAGLAVLPASAQVQFLADSESSSAAPASMIATPTVQTYTSPAQTTRLQNYLLDAFGPYPMVSAAMLAGINQADKSPPEWKQGVEGYGKRFGSDFGFVGVSITTRYALAGALNEDTLYYRCECKGFFPRLGHAVVSTLTARQGADGHRVFSVPGLAAPYAGATVAVFGWYPNRYSAEDAFRMGNYSLLGFIGENIALEFFHRGPHSLLSRMHFNDRHAAPDPGAER
jgi:hypothetical protein